MKEIERIIEGWFIDGKIVNNPDSTATIEELAKAIEQYVIKARIEEHKFMCFWCRDNKKCERIAELREKLND